MKKDCTNCLYECCCNWEKADQTLCCDDWEDEQVLVQHLLMMQNLKKTAKGKEE